MSPFWTQKHDFWGSRWHCFFIILGNEQKSWKLLVFQYFSMVLDHQKPLIFRLISHCFFHWVFHVFSKPPPGAVFRRSQCRFFIKNWFVVPFSIFIVFKKAPFGQPFRQSRRPKTPPASHRTAPCHDPVFHKTILINVPLGPNGFKKVIFPTEIGSLSMSFCFSLCYVLYNMFITLLIKPR